MAYFEFIWNDALTEHIAEHDVSPEEFQDIVCNPVSTAKSDSSGLPVAFGYAQDGRYIIAIYELLDEITVLPVTAYEVNEP